MSRPEFRRAAEEDRRRFEEIYLATGGLLWTLYKSREGENDTTESCLLKLEALEDVFEGLCCRRKPPSLQNEKPELSVPGMKLKRKLRKYLNTLQNSF